MVRSTYPCLVDGLNGFLEEDVLRLKVGVYKLEVCVEVVECRPQLVRNVRDLVELEGTAAVEVVEQAEAKLGEDNAHMGARELRVGGEVGTVLNCRVEVLRVVGLDPVEDADLELCVACVLINGTDKLDGDVRLALSVPCFDHLGEGALTDEVEDLPSVCVGGAVHVVAQHHVVVARLLALLRCVGLLLLAYRLLVWLRCVGVAAGALASTQTLRLLLTHLPRCCVVVRLYYVRHLVTPSMS